MNTASLSLRKFLESLFKAAVDAANPIECVRLSLPGPREGRVITRYGCGFETHAGLKLPRQPTHTNVSDFRAVLVRRGEPVRPTPAPRLIASARH